MRKSFYQIYYDCHSSIPSDWSDYQCVYINYPQYSVFFENVEGVVKLVFFMITTIFLICLFI